MEQRTGTLAPIVDSPDGCGANHKADFEKRQAWGIATSVDLYECDSEKIRDANFIKKFVEELCDLIEMKRFGECQIVNFGEDERVAGYSMMQLIETSLISAHFANASNAVYLDVFSCKYYEPIVAAQFAFEKFGAKSCRLNVNLRH